MLLGCSIRRRGERGGESFLGGEKKEKKKERKPTVEKLCSTYREKGQHS